jgi:predicted anti-sigma-YlaC factor YlaD
MASPERDFLLALLRFVALISPAIVILMQVVSSVDHDNEIEIGPIKFDELDVLKSSLGLILAGGTLIGIKLLSIMSDPVVMIAVILIFSALPASAFAAWLFRKEDAFSGQGSIKDVIFSMKIVRLAVGTIIPAAIYYIALKEAESWLNQKMSIGLMTEGNLTPTIILGIALVLTLLKGIYTAYRRGLLFDSDLEEFVSVVGNYSILLPFAMSVFLMPVWGVLIAVAVFTPVERSQAIFNIILLWVILIYWAIMAHEYDPE